MTLNRSGRKTDTIVLLSPLIDDFDNDRSKKTVNRIHTKHHTIEGEMGVADISDSSITVGNT